MKRTECAYSRLNYHRNDARKAVMEKVESSVSERRENDVKIPCFNCFIKRGWDGVGF